MYTLEKLATLVGGRVAGNPAVQIKGASEIQYGKPGTITFLSNPKYLKYLSDTKASAIVINDELLLGDKDGIVVENTQLAFALILELFSDKTTTVPVIHKTAIVAISAKIGDNVAIGPYSVVASGAVIGDNVNIGSHASIGPKVQIGKETKIQANVVIHSKCQVGMRCMLLSGAVVGSRGFGFVTDADTHHSVPQNGAVIIGNDVEIGANTTIDRGTISNTIIGDGTKIDNLVQIAHNVKIGKGCLVAALVGFAGSTEVGNFCIFAGQAGVAPHLKIGDRAIFAAKTGITKSLEGGKIYAGMPAREIREKNKRDAIFSQVQILKKRLESIEEKVVS
ncbi:UDP-3-O-(3-hydroxymyristoyl)glucosamine N-acyltransferase [Candidatus Neomarinimicrobiota bacterium]